MKILNDENLKKYVTVKIGGIAKNLYFPESINDLTTLLTSLSGSEYYILGGGSNVLMNDKKTYEHIISMKKMDLTIKNIEKNMYYVGASVPIQKLINTINKDGYGGIEYLSSVPALVGGAVVMNAGRGKKHGLCISDFIKDVHIYDSGEIKVLKKEECHFEYRNSIFKHSEIVVLGATFEFEWIGPEEGTKRKKDRIQLVKKLQDNTGFNFGSTFREHNKVIMQIFKLLHPGYKNGMRFSNKTSNRIINQGDGSFTQTVKLIEKVKKVHKLVGKKADPEVIIWK